MYSPPDRGNQPGLVPGDPVPDHGGPLQPLEELPRTAQGPYTCLFCLCPWPGGSGTTGTKRDTGTKSTRRDRFQRPALPVLRDNGRNPISVLPHPGLLDLSRVLDGILASAQYDGKRGSRAPVGEAGHSGTAQPVPVQLLDTLTTLTTSAGSGT